MHVTTFHVAKPLKINSKIHTIKNVILILLKMVQYILCSSSISLRNEFQSILGWILLCFSR